MTNREKLVRDIETLRESLRVNREELANRPMSDAELRGIVQHGAWLMDELAQLLALASKPENSN
jgi:hypothetical protein